MKSIALLLTSFLTALTLSAQTDDVYYSPKYDGDQAEVQDNTPEPKQDARKYDYDEDETYSDYYEDEYSETEKKTDGSGNTYITNNYYGDYYGSDYEYTTRLRRFYRPYIGFSYFSPCYVGFYYDPFYYDPWWGWSVSVSWMWGYPNYYWYYDPWYSPYYHPWWSHWGYGHHGYWHGYYHGYWDGYYDGYYGYPYGDYYIGKNYHYGPRYKSQGIGAYRNTYAEKRAGEDKSIEQQNAVRFPSGENKDVLKPVKIDNPEKTGMQVTDKNQTGPIEKAVKPGNIQMEKEKPQPVHSGEMKPQNNADDIRKPANNEIIRGNMEPNDLKPMERGGENITPAPKPGNMSPKTKPLGNEMRAPAERDQIQPQPKNFEQPSKEREMKPKASENYQIQRGNVYGKKTTKQSIPKSERQYGSRHDKPNYDNRMNVPNEQRAPSREAAPKSFDRGGIQKQSHFENGGSIDRGQNMGGKEYSPKQGGRNVWNPR